MSMHPDTHHVITLKHRDDTGDVVVIEIPEQGVAPPIKEGARVVFVCDTKKRADDAAAEFMGRFPNYSVMDGAEAAEEVYEQVKAYLRRKRLH